MAILAPKDFEINRVAIVWVGQIGHPFLVILSSAKFFAMIYRWRLTGGPRPPFSRSVDVANDAKIIAMLRESFVVPRISHVVVIVPNNVFIFLSFTLSLPPLLCHSLSFCLLVSSF